MKRLTKEELHWDENGYAHCPSCVVYRLALIIVCGESSYMECDVCGAVVHVTDVVITSRWGPRDGHSPPQVPTSPGRNAAIIDMRQDGYTYEEIAHKFGLSRERVHQLCVKLMTPGAMERAKNYAKHRHTERWAWLHE